MQGIQCRLGRYTLILMGILASRFSGGLVTGVITVDAHAPSNLLSNVAPI